MAMCCQLPVEVTQEDLVVMELIDEFESELGQKYILKKLKNEGIVKSYQAKSQKYLLVQHHNGDCLFLDQNRRCSIYDKRPTTCRNHPKIGPRPGYCPYTPKS